MSVDGGGGTIVLEVTRGGPAPAGELSGPEGAPEPFDGWLQLLSALERQIDLLPNPTPKHSGYRRRR